MSDSPDPVGLTLKEQIARIDRNQAEIQKLFEEAAKLRSEDSKLRSEDMKLRAEQIKLNAEAGKFKRETITAPLIAGASIVAATAALTTGLIKLFGG